MMMKPASLISVITFLSLIGFACGHRTGEQQASVQPQHPTEQDPSLVVQIEVNPNNKLGKPLELRWKLSNAGVKPIYVYSTLLRWAAGAEVEIDAEQRTIEVRFLRLQPISGGVNFFPEAEFVQVEPKGVREGRFNTFEPIGEESVERITPGDWRIRALIAYGYEIESVKKALAESLVHGEEHPINPIVKWQKIAYSDPVNVSFQR